MRAILILSVCATIMLFANVVQAQPNATPTTLRKLADDYYNWRNENYPVFSSDAGLHSLGQQAD
jgi:hypothetical protein